MPSRTRTNDEDGPSGRSGGALRARRIGLGLTKAELARASGLDRRTIDRLEGGAPVSDETIARVVEALRPSPRRAGSTSPDHGDHAAALRELRRRRGLSVAAFAVYGVSASKMSRIERGISEPREEWEILLDEIAAPLGFRGVLELRNELVRLRESLGTPMERHLATLVGRGDGPSGADGPGRLVRSRDGRGVGVLRSDGSRAGLLPKRSLVTRRVLDGAVVDGVYFRPAVGFATGGAQLRERVAIYIVGEQSRG